MSLRFVRNKYKQRDRNFYSRAALRTAAEHTRKQHSGKVSRKSDEGSRMQRHNAFFTGSFVMLRRTYF